MMAIESNIQNADAPKNPWILAARPKTLTAAVVPVVVGTALAFWEMAGLENSAEIKIERVLLALISACSIQVGTNYFNDAIDFTRGADTTARLGPPRATQLGLLTSKQMLHGAWCAFALAIITGAILVAVAGPEILAIGLLSLLFGYAYTGGPFPLAYRGLGDVFVLLFFGVIAVMGSAFLQLGTWPISGFIAGLQVGLLAVVLIVINNFRDSNGDRAVGKYTLAVLLGERFSRLEIAGATFAPILLGAFWVERGAVLAALLPLLALPVMSVVVRGMWRASPSAECNTFLGQAAKVHALFGVLLAAGLVMSALWK
jgi:1,4-dihydroxy-2-naphthoate octaprenyltransferase